MKWILIVMYSMTGIMGGSSHSAIAFQEFNTSEACVNASKEAIKLHYHFSGNMRYACVPKGKE